jgi:hypothetical protein
MLLKLKNIILYIMIAFVIINFIIEWIFPDKIYDLMFNLCNNNEIYFSDISNFSFYFLILTFILIVVNLIYDSYVNKKFVFKIIYIPIILLLDVTVFFTVPFNYLWLGYRFGDYEDYKSYVFDKTFTYTNIYLSEGELNGNSETKKYFYLPFINKIYFIDSDGIKGYNITINHDSDTVIIGDDKYIIQSNYFSDSYYDYDYDDE